MFNSMYDLIQGRREADIFSQGNVDNRPRTLAEAIKEVLKIDYNGKTGSNIVGVGSETGIERRRGSTGDVERGGRGTEGERAADGKGRAKGDAGEEGVAEKRKALHPSSVASKDNQGNPLNADGTLKLEKVKSVDDLTDEDFSAPTRNVELPAIPKNVDDAIGANGKPIIIKKNIFERNAERHNDLTSSQSREILHSALYNPDLYGQSQKAKRPYNWVVINTKDEKGHNRTVLLEISPNKDNIEIVHWHYVDERGLEKIKRQAEREDGQLLILPSAKEEAGALSSPTSGLSSDGKDTAKASKKQGKGKKKVEPGQQVDYYSAFAEQYGLDAEDVKKEAVANASEKAKEVKGLSNKLKDRYPTSLYLLGRDITDMEEMVANGEVSPKRVERVRSEIKRLKGLLADYERLATPEERSWRNMKAEHPDEIVVEDNGNGMLIVCQEDVKATNKAIGQKLDAPVTENLIVTTNEEQGMPFTTMRVTLADLQRLDDKGVKYVVLDKNGNQAKKERQHKADVVENPSHGEEVLRDAVIDKLRESGIEVLGAEGQKVLDMANGKDVRLEAKRKRALETATIADESTNNATVVSSAAGAKVQNNLEILAEGYQKRPNKTKGFITDLSRSLGLKQHESSQYGTFVTGNGKTVTIRVSNHNARVSNFDRNGENDGISIVISSHKNKGLNNDGDAHVTEFFYPKRSLERAGSKPLSEVIRSFSEALNSGEFNDPTGLAERQEVNAYDVIILQKVYHGSGADFDHFDHSHMGEGEGAQAHGYGTYVSVSEGTARGYAKTDAQDRNSEESSLTWYGRESSIDDIIDDLKESYPDTFGEWLDGVPYNNSNIYRIKKILKTIQYADEQDITDLENDLYARIEEPGANEEYKAFYKEVLKNVLPYASGTLPYDSNIYTVEIPNNRGNYLEEYKDYGSRTKLRRGIDKALTEIGREGLGSGTMNGRDIYDTLTQRLGSKQAASEFLEKLGMVGVHYFGQQNGECYVIFNDRDLTITDHVRFFKTKNGEAYGFTVGGKIYYDPRIATSETPIHEYGHLWASALRSGNPKEWENVVGLMKGTPVWDEVKKRYPELETDDEIADEVIATYSGRRGAERLRSEAAKIAGSMDELDAVKALSALQRVKEALKRFWKGVCDFLHIHFTSAEEVADRVMKDLLDGVDPRKFMKGKDGRPRFQFIGEKGAERADHAEEVSTRLDNLDVAREMEEAKKDAKAIKMATGWERGADGKWRYEMPDAKIKDTIDVGGGNIVKRFEEDMLWTDGKLEDAVDAPKLFEAYPQLKNIKIHTDAVMNDMPSNGFYNPQTNTITIHADELKYLNSILNHEVQHAIQNIEGFAKGGNSETVRSRIQRIIDEEKDASEYAKSNLKQYAALHMLASRLKASKQFAKSDQQFFKDKAREYYWDAMNELDNNERSTLINEYPDDKNAQEIAESGYHVDEAIKELKRIADEYKDEIPKGNMDAFEKVNKLTSALENKSDDELYQALAGEVEARNVQKRMGMTPEERRNSLAEETEDVSRGDQIVMNNGGTSYSIVKDPETIKKLDKEDTVKVYRAMQVGEDGKLYPPMAAKVKGKFVQPIELGKWEQADERPELADDKGMFTLNKGNGKSLKAAYNPYLHTSRTPLNDQFSEAQNRPNIVTVEVEVPKSELTSGYKADKAKDAVGEVEWKAGIIQGQLTGKRKVILSRWDKPVRIVPDSEVADVIVNDMFKGKNITMPSNVVTPSLRKELEKRGVPFVETDNRGRIVGGENDGVHYAKVYGKKANVKHRLGEKGFDDGEREELDRVNERFNEELTRYQNGEMDKNEMLHLGRPQGVMRAFLPNLPIVMRQRVIKKGSEKKHEVDVSAIMNMPQHLSSPIFVFQRSEDTIGVLTDMRDRNGKNVCVAIELKRQIQQGAEYLEVNDVRSFHGREFKNIVEPIANNKTLKWVDKEKGLAYLSSASQPVQQEIDKQVLDTATKVVKDFVNPKVSDENVADDGIKLSLGDGGSREREQMDEARMVERVKATGESLGGAEVHVYTSFVDVPEEYKKEVKKGARGWYDPETHTVHVYLPNCASGDEAQRTVFHESRLSFLFV